MGSPTDIDPEKLKEEYEKLKEENESLKSQIEQLKEEVKNFIQISSNKRSSQQNK